MHGVRPRARCFASRRGARARLSPCSRGPLAWRDPRRRTCRNRPRTVQVALPDIQSGLKRPRKDLHTSGSTAHPGNGLAVCALSSCKNRRRECSPAPKRGRETPEGAVFCALRNLALPPECLNRSVKCAAFDADLVAAPAPCRSGCRGEAPCPSETWAAVLERPDSADAFSEKNRNLVVRVLTRLLCRPIIMV